MAVTAKKIVEDTTPSPTSPGINADDLTRNAIDLISEKTAIRADALVLKTGQQMVGTLLDIFDVKEK